MTITEFLLARITEDEQAARAVPPLDHNFNMGGKRQDEYFTHGRRLPSSMDGMGNFSKHEGSPTTGAHFARWDPARVLRECEAKRRIIELADEAEGLDCSLDFDILAALAAPYADHPDCDPSWMTSRKVP